MTTAPAVRERPIIFSGDSVRQILRGSKTQTRRVVKNLNPTFVAANPTCEQIANAVRCPYGQPGDTLWVRESGWEVMAPSIDQIAGGADTWPGYVYDSDGSCPDDAKNFRAWGWKRRPSIYMPRWASRLTLEITGVRVERLNAIGEDDAVAEGQARHTKPPESISTVEMFAHVWDSINAKRSGGSFAWARNPLVWMLSFTVSRGSRGGGV